MEMGLLFGAIIDQNGQLWPVLVKIWGIMSIAIPIIIIVLSTVDFMLAITKDDDYRKKALNKFMKRLILGVLFFLLPVILNLLLSWTVFKSTGM